MSNAVPGTELCTPGVRRNHLKRRWETRETKRLGEKDYVSFTTDGSTHFEENRMSRKKRVFLVQSRTEPEYFLFSSKTEDIETVDLQCYFHPCIRNDRLFRDLSIDFQRFMANATAPRRQSLLRALQGNVVDQKATTLFVMQSIKFDGEHMGIPITHVYSTRAFHPGNVSRLNTSVRTYSRFDFIEAMYTTGDGITITPGS